MSNVIQDLKENCKPFGLMTKEMQVKAREIGCKGNFEIYSGLKDDGGGGWGVVTSPDHPLGSFYGSSCTTYKLRPDFEETPEIKTCPFCGSRARYIHYTAHVTRAHTVTCDNVDSCSAYPKVHCETKNEAIELWNERL